MNIDKIIDRVRKLHALSQNNTSAEEAATAAEAVQKLIAQYDLQIDVEQETQPEPDEPIQEWTDDPIENAGRIAKWKKGLIRTLGNENNCRHYYHGTRVILIGRASDVQKVHYLYRYLRGEVDRLTKALAYGHGRSWANSFRLGCANEIRKKIEGTHERLAEAKRGDLAAQGASKTAMVRVSESLATWEAKGSATEAWEKENMNYGRSRSYGGSTSRLSLSGYNAGRAAGQTVRVGGAKASIGSGE